MTSARDFVQTALLLSILIWIAHRTWIWRESDRWTYADHNAWAAEFQKRNPDIDVPKSVRVTTK